MYWHTYVHVGAIAGLIWGQLSNMSKPFPLAYMVKSQGCRKVVKSGGGNISDYILLFVPYTSSMPPRNVWYFCALRQLLV